MPVIVFLLKKGFYREQVFYLCLRLWGHHGRISADSKVQANIPMGSIQANSHCKKLRTRDLYLQEADERELPIRDQVRGETCKQKQ